MERILSEYDVFLAPDCSMIGYSDVTEQCSQEIAGSSALLRGAWPRTFLVSVKSNQKYVANHLVWLLRLYNFRYP